MKVSLRENPQGTGIPGGEKNKHVLLMSENRLVCLDKIFVVTSDLRLTRLMNFMTHLQSISCRSDSSGLELKNLQVSWGILLVTFEETLA